MLEGLRGEESIAELCRREGIASSRRCTMAGQKSDAARASSTASYSTGSHTFHCALRSPTERSPNFASTTPTTQNGLAKAPISGENTNPSRTPARAWGTWQWLSAGHERVASSAIVLAAQEKTSLVGVGDNDQRTARQRRRSRSNHWEPASAEFAAAEKLLQLQVGGPEPARFSLRLD